MTHVTPSDVAAFRARTLDRERVEAIGAHVRACEECARLVWGDPGITDSAESVWSDAAPARAPRRRLLAWAAVAACVVAAIAIWITRDDPRPRPNVPPKKDDVQLIAKQVRDGAVAITMNENGAVTDVSTSRVEWNELAIDALRDGRVPEGPRTNFADAGEVLRGFNDGGPQVKLVAPVAVVVESDRPEFRWTAVPRARYRVVIARDGAPVAKSELLTATSWQPPRPLRRGETYAWQLTVVRGDQEWTIPAPEAPPAQLRVLGEAAWRELEDARATNSRLVTGLVAASHGLRERAARELDAFAREHPEIPGAAKLAVTVRPRAPRTPTNETDAGSDGRSSS